MKAVNLLGRLICQDQGISALEYALMLSLIGAGLMAAVVGLGSQAGSNFNNATAVLKG